MSQFVTKLKAKPREKYYLRLAKLKVTPAESGKATPLQKSNIKIPTEATARAEDDVLSVSAINDHKQQDLDLEDPPKEVVFQKPKPTANKKTPSLVSLPQHQFVGKHRSAAKIAQSFTYQSKSTSIMSETTGTFYCACYDIFSCAHTFVFNLIFFRKTSNLS